MHIYTLDNHKWQEIHIQESDTYAQEIFEDAEQSDEEIFQDADEGPSVIQSLHVWDSTFESNRETSMIKRSDVSVKFISEGTKRHYKRIDMEITNIRSSYHWKSGYGWSIEKHGDNIYSTGGSPRSGLGVWKLLQNSDVSSPKTHLWQLIYTKGDIQTSDEHNIGARMIQDVMNYMNF